MEEEYITIAEAARRVRKSDKQVRRWVHQGKLVARYPQPNRAQVAVSDLEPFLPGYDPDLVDVNKRLAALEQRITEIEQVNLYLSEQVRELTERNRQLEAQLLLAQSLPAH